MLFKVFYNDFVEVDLEDGHRFPMEKYSILRARLLDEKILINSQLVAAKEIDKDKLKIAHCPQYVEDFFQMKLEAKMIRTVGLPLNNQMKTRTLTSVGAVFEAACAAMKDGVATALCGGTHHAHYDRGEGFCYFNDFAVIHKNFRQLNRAHRSLIIDLDVHQGNGNSTMLSELDGAYTISFHGKNNYPFRKELSYRDIALDDNTKDDEYLDLLNQTLSEFDPNSYDLILYQAGVDVLEGDRFGKLSLTHEGIRRRDAIVFEFCRSTPLVMALGGGYSDPIENSIQAYVNTYKELTAYLTRKEFNEN